MTIDNPWDSVAGARAMENMFRLLAAGEGATADFAKAVVAGQRSPHELLSHGPAIEELGDRVRRDVDAWDRLPQRVRTALMEQAPAAVQRQVDELADMDVEAALAEAPAPTETSEPLRHTQQRDDGNDADDWFGRPLKR